MTEVIEQLEGKILIQKALIKLSEQGKAIIEAENITWQDKSNLIFGGINERVKELGHHIQYTSLDSHKLDSESYVSELEKLCDSFIPIEEGYGKLLKQLKAIEEL